MKNQFVAVLLLLAAVRIDAATRTWAGGSGNWSDPAKWVGGIAPSPGDDLVFPAGGFGTAVNDYPAGTVFRSITHRHPAITGNAIVLGAGGYTGNGSSAFELPVTLGAAQTWHFRETRFLTHATNLNGHALTITAAPSIEFLRWDGPFTGTGSITLNAVPEVWIDGANTTTAPLNVIGSRVLFFSDYYGVVTGTGGAQLIVRDGNTGGFGLTNSLLSNSSDDTYTGSLSFSGGTYATLPTSRMLATGSVSLGNAVLSLGSASTLQIAPGTTFTIIDNDGTDPVTGTFAGLPEGASIQGFIVSYRGGTGNDVVLTAGAYPYNTLLVSNRNDSGPGSLRQAVLDSNALFGLNPIVFLQGLSGTITLTSGEIAITSDAWIRGPGSSIITVSGNNASRIFNIDAQRVSIEGLTLTAGSAPAGGAIDARVNSLALYDVHVTNSVALTGDGGAIRSREPGDPSSIFRFLTPEIVFSAARSTFSGNRAAAGDGGALWIRARRLAFHEVTIDGNTAGGDGGGVHGEIYYGDPNSPREGLQLIGSAVSNNRSGDDGGGLAIDTLNTVERRSSPRVYGSRIVGNTAAGDGGGLHTTSSSDWVFAHSEISGNTAMRGGGLFNDWFDCCFNSPIFGIVQTTVANNVATTEGGGLWMPINSELNGATVTGNSAGIAGGNVFYQRGSNNNIYNSIVADGIAATNPDIHTVTATPDAAYSLIETPGSASITIGSGVITGQDPLLGPLQFDPRSPTQSRLPQAGSPVIDAGFRPLGDYDFQRTLDQRFYARIIGAAIDMGSVERNAPLPVADLSIVKTASPNPQIVGEPVTYTKTVTNHGPAAAGLLFVTDAIPNGSVDMFKMHESPTCAGLTIVTCFPFPFPHLGEFEATCTPAVCGMIPAGSQATMSFSVRYGLPGTFSNYATVASPADTNTANNAAFAPVTIQNRPAQSQQAFDLSVTQSVAPAQADVGDEVTFTAVVRNAGPAEARNVTVNVPLPLGVELLGVTTTAGTCALFGSRVGCTIDVLPAGGSATIAIRVRVTGTGSIPMTASVTARGTNGDAPETTLQNNSATAVLVVTGATHASNIPTLGEWMLLLLIAALALAGAALTTRAV